ncbi:tol-pal system protein YbgF [Roseovarius sp. 2305UL8-3]|uniref:tol-pal system protein YbgF n=1 Tax=Roseovarius conchicola TaxID=3121636 RepID=UPI0035289605
MRRFFSLLVVVGLSLPAMGQAQSSDQTLADIRQEMSVLYVEIQRLNRELSTTGSAGTATAGGSLIDRVNAIESELQRLTAQTEQLDLRIQSVVKDGTNRLGDLEFRLCELEADCDLGQLSEGTTLGGVEVTTDVGTTIGQTTEQPDVQMAVGEEADFNQAEEALAAGNWAEAAQLFETFRQNYPGGPLTDKAGIMRGDALEGAGDLTGAARAYLDVFSTAPEGPMAPDALYNLGRSLGALGQTDEACVTLGEVGQRFPNSDAVLEAQSAMANLSCP